LDNEQYSNISRKLDRILTLLSLTAIKGLQQDEQILALSSAGFQPSDIGPMLGKTPNAVSIALHRIRKRTQKQLNATGDTNNANPSIESTKELA